MSKLPRLSNTSEHVPPPDPDDSAAPIPSTANVKDTPMTRGELLGAEVWLSAILGIIFMWMGRTFAIYVIGQLTGHPHHTGVNWSPGTLHAGQEVPYPQLDASFGLPFWTDASLFLFGLAMFFEAIVLVASASSRGLRRPLVYLAFSITVIAVAFNLFAIGKCMSNGITPIISLLATAFGVYIAMYEWALIKLVRT